MENKTVKVTIGIIIAIIVIGGALLIFQNPTGHTVKNTNEPIKIGVFAPLSGEAAIYGNAMKKGLDLATEDINNQGGILGRKVELVYEDTHLDPKAAVAVMNKFINIDKFQIVIAAEGSGATFAAAPLADSTKTLMMVGIASTPTLKNAGDYVFRVVPSDTYQGKEIVRLAKKFGYKKAGILYVNDIFGVGIKDVFQQEFSKVIVEESFEVGSTDFRTQLAKIKSFGPDVTVIVARAEFPLILKQTRELRLDSQIIASAELKDESLVKASDIAAEGVFVPYYAKTVDYVNFETKFKAKYGTDPALFSDYGYDALGILATAIEDANSINSEQVKDSLYNAVFQGATGIVKFDEFGEVTEKPFVIYQIKNGEFVEFPI